MRWLIALAGGLWSVVIVSMLSFYRSQHDNESWLAALTAVLDTSALVSIGVEGACQRQARLPPVTPRALHVGAGADEKLAERRRMYEPYEAALSQHLIMPLPPWRAGATSRENWRTTAGGKARAGRRGHIGPHEDD